MKNKKTIILIVAIIFIIILGTKKALGNKQDDNWIDNRELQQIIENIENENSKVESHKIMDNSEELYSSLVEPMTD